MPLVRYASDHAVGHYTIDAGRQYHDSANELEKMTASVVVPGGMLVYVDGGVELNWCRKTIVQLDFHVGRWKARFSSGHVHARISAARTPRGSPIIDYRHNLNWKYWSRRPIDCGEPRL